MHLQFLQETIVTDVIDKAVVITVAARAETTVAEVETTVVAKSPTTVIESLLLVAPLPVARP